MGLHESVSCWRWQGSGGAFRAAVGVLLLGLSLAQSVPTHAACPAAAAPQSVPQPQYQDMEKDVMGFLSGFVHSFLQTVQPNALPKDLIMNIVQDPDQLLKSTQGNLREFLVYEVGFLVCTAIGVLYIVLMPIVGFFLACCRCCGNCGGKMYQKQTSSTNCHRRSLYWTAFGTTAIILAGNICMFMSNTDIKVSVDQSQVELKKSINNIHSYLTSVPQQIDKVVNESYRTVEEVSRNLDAIGPQLGKEIKAQFRGTLDPALSSVRLLDQETVNTSLGLSQLNSSLTQLQSSMERLQDNFTAIKDRMLQTISNASCVGCINLKPELEKLTLDTSITIPSLSEFESAMDEVNKTNLPSKIKEMEDYFDSIPERVTNETKGIVQSSKQLLGNIKTQISQVTNDIPLSSLTDLIGSLDQVQSQMLNYTPKIERAEEIRGAGFSFLFSWLFMIVVTLLFLLGGNLSTLICRPWNNGQLLELLATPGIIPGLDLGQSLGLKTNITIPDVYRDCKQNQPLWTTLHLYELINLDDLLNVSKYTGQIQQEFEKQLGSFSNKASNLDSTAVTEKMNNVSSINLNTTADQLDVFAAIQSNNGIKKELINEARDLRQIQADIETIIIPQLENLNSTIKSFRSIADQINGTVGEVLSNVGTAQDFLNTNTTQIVRTESRKFLDCQLGYFIVYVDWANLTITQQVGRCGPVAGAVDSVDNILCSHLVDSLNAFWFSLGWCMIFFIPGIIFSMKLAKYYRRMKYSDAFDDHLIMNPIPRAQMKFT
ncbi:Prominin-1-A [Dissostichus eleginoides]|uniref:Prominin-1-A n=1 Tax=Dissostichus eleginoides TaxID=100907 RepID=A0AAD9CNG4_DISEL|nr:Prominin-1-A [Dissostichus eleginoides]